MTKNIEYASLLYFLILMIPTFYIIVKFNRGDFLKKSIISLIRMVVQLLFLGLYLNYIFQLNNTYINIAYLLFMVCISTHSVIDSTFLRDKKIIYIIFITILVPFIASLYIFEVLVLKLDNVYDAMYLIPISGMLLGNTLNSIILVLNDFLSNLKKHKDEYIFYVTMGANKHEALRPYIESSILIAIKPRIANMATVGLVSIPGMMTGQILGGNGPMIAIKYQIAIMFSIFGISVISTYLVLQFIIKYYFDEYGMIDSKILNNE